MKYKIGDKVRVREDLIEFERYKEVLFVPSMSSFKGKIVTIYYITDIGYKIKEDSKRYYWTDDMFSGKVSEDLSSKESNSQNTTSEGENSSDIITVKPIKVKLLLL